MAHKRCKIWADAESESFLKQVQKSLGVKFRKKRVGMEKALHHICENYQEPVEGDKISITFGSAFATRKLR